MAVAQVMSLSGCPFSADVIFDMNQTLADGTHTQKLVQCNTPHDERRRDHPLCHNIAKLRNFQFALRSGSRDGTRY